VCSKDSENIRTRRLPSSMEHLLEDVSGIPRPAIRSVQEMAFPRSHDRPDHGVQLVGRVRRSRERDMKSADVLRLLDTDAETSHQHQKPALRLDLPTAKSPCNVITHRQVVPKQQMVARLSSRDDGRRAIPSRSRYRNMLHVIL
jgi:hypothetical protein